MLDSSRFNLQANTDKIQHLLTFVRVSPLHLGMVEHRLSDSMYVLVHMGTNGLRLTQAFISRLYQPNSTLNRRMGKHTTVNELVQ